MPTLSSRITSINTGGSDGWEVFYRSRRMIDAGVDVTELTIGEHDIGTDQSILDAMHKAASGGHTGYPEVPGIHALRREIAKRLATSTGVPTEMENVIITPGGQSGLFACHIAIGSPGDTALYVDPCYVTYPGTLRSTSLNAVPVPTRSRDAFLPQPEVIDRLAKETGAKSLLLNSPNNPTGMVYPREHLIEIGKVCEENDMWIISDEVYDTQVWDGDHISPRALPGLAERTLLIGSMSKSHAMTGSRMGWVVAPAPMINSLIDLATNTTYGVPGYIQDAALFALQQGEALESKVAEPFRRRRDLLLDVLAKQEFISAIPAKGAMYLMLDIRKTGMSGEEFANALLDAHHIAVMPGESFGTSAAGHIRLALTIEDSKLVSAVQTLCDFAQSLAKTDA